MRLQLDDKPPVENDTIFCKNNSDKVKIWKNKHGFYTVLIYILCLSVMPIENKKASWKLQLDKHEHVLFFWEHAGNTFPLFVEAIREQTG